jgi:hypothetical protein
MGFSIELSKKALIQTKNAGIAAAMDIILKLAEEENLKKPKKKIESKKETKKLKVVWNCGACTFENTESSNICEICGNEAD